MREREGETEIQKEKDRERMRERNVRCGLDSECLSEMCLNLVCGGVEDSTGIVFVSGVEGDAIQP